MSTYKFSRIEKFLSSDKGKRILNYGYSWGASLVILGALFKIIHLPFANLMLSVGMITEAIIFFVLGFDLPATAYKWEEVFPVLKTKDEADRPDFSNLGNGIQGGNVVVMGGGNVDPNTIAAVNTQAGQTAAMATPGTSAQGAAFVGVGGMGGGMPQSFIPEGLNISETDVENLSDSIKRLSEAAQQFTKMAQYVDSFGQTTSNLSQVSETLLGAYKGISDNSEGIVNNSIDYINQMEAVNRNLSGLNTIYEIQLKSLSSQIEAIDKVNTSLNRIKDIYEYSAGDSGRFREETEKMSQQLAALNAVYGRILNAMTMNIYNSPNRY